MDKQVFSNAVLALSALVILASCSSSDTSASRSHPDDSARMFTSQADADAAPIEFPGPTPLHKFFTSPEEGVVIEQATDVLTARCMRAAEYAYAVPVYASKVEAAIRWNDQAESRLYGPTNRQTARRFGLGIDLSGAGDDENAGELASSASYLTALLGSDSGIDLPVDDTARPGAGEVKTPHGGCLGQARLRITGSTDGLPRDLGRELWIHANSDAQSSPRYDAVTADYTACMKRAGYRVTAVLDDQGDTTKFKRDLASTEPSGAEIDFALTQIDCKKQVDLVPRLRSIEVDYSASATKKHHAALQKDRRHIDDAVRVARRVLRR